MEDIKVVSVSYGKLDFRRILKKNYPQLRVEFKKKNSQELPTWDVLKNQENNIEYLNVFMSPAKVKLHTESDGVLNFTIKPGFFSDLASIPKIFHSIVDDNEDSIVVASIIHDGLFKTHLMSFKESNNIFKDIMIEEDAKKLVWKAAYKAVSSKVGRNHYEKYDDETQTRNKKVFKMTWTAR